MTNPASGFGTAIEEKGEGGTIKMPIPKNSVQELSIEWLAIKGMATVYCIKCRKKVEIKHPYKLTMEGVQGINGVCSVCGARVFRVGKT